MRYIRELQKIIKNEKISNTQKEKLSDDAETVTEIVPENQEVLVTA
jgi:hypothetical protein